MPNTHKIKLNRGKTMKYATLYMKYVICPLEEKIKEIKLKIYQKRFYLSKKKDEQYLLKMEKLLFYYYEKLNQILEEELSIKK